MGPLGDYIPGDERRFATTTYTAPKFECLSARGALNKAEALAKQAKETLDLANAQTEEAKDFVELARELYEAGLTTVADLPEDRQRYWKTKLHKPIMVSLSNA